MNENERKNEWINESKRMERNEWMNGKDDRNIITVIKLQLGKCKRVSKQTLASLFPLFPSFTAPGWIWTVYNFRDLLQQDIKIILD
jgi:hypothetical protein